MKPETEYTELTPWDRLDQAFRTILTVPKDKLRKEEARVKDQRKKRRTKKRG
jgi:hypothetical protein